MTQEMLGPDIEILVDVGPVQGVADGRNLRVVALLRGGAQQARVAPERHGDSRPSCSRTCMRASSKLAPAIPSVRPGLPKKSFRTLGIGVAPHLLGDARDLMIREAHALHQRAPPPEVGNFGLYGSQSPAIWSSV
jgi:hypothetical protein